MGFRQLNQLTTGKRPKSGMLAETSLLAFYMQKNKPRNHFPKGETS